MIGQDTQYVYKTEGAWPTTFIVQRLEFSSAEPMDRLYKGHFELFIPTRPLTVTDVSGSFHRTLFHYRLGTIGFSPPSINWRIKWDGAIEGVLLIWEPEVIEAAVAKLFNEDMATLTWRRGMGDHVPAIAFLGLDIASQISSGYPAGKAHVELLMESLLSLCLRRYASSETRATSLVGIMSRQVLHAVGIINTKLTTDLTIDEICAHGAVSKSHLNRLFRTELGLSPWEFVQRQRILHAGELLKTTGNTIDSICEQLRFKSRSNFVKRFTSEYGCTPREYRKNNSNCIS